MLTAERLRELVHYDPETGVMTRRVALSNRNKVGQVVGYLNRGDGYLYATVDAKSHAVHRLAWLYVTGAWPEHQVNHKNDKRTDNRFANLLDRPKAVHLAERAAAVERPFGLPADGVAAALIVRAIMTYEAGTGLLRWAIKASKYSNIKPGDVFGARKPRGYWGGSVLGRSYASHRLVWLHVHGDWPRGEIDHIDGNPGNNRADNLRDVCRVVNAQNQRRAMSTNMAGLIGAHWDGSIGKYRPRIKANGRYQYLGVYSTAEESHQAYVAAKRRLHEGSTL